MLSHPLPQESLVSGPVRGISFSGLSSSLQTQLLQGVDHTQLTQFGLTSEARRPTVLTAAKSITY